MATQRGRKRLSLFCASDAVFDPQRLLLHYSAIRSMEWCRPASVHVFLACLGVTDSMFQSTPGLYHPAVVARSKTRFCREAKALMSDPEQRELCAARVSRRHYQSAVLHEDVDGACY